MSRKKTVPPNIAIGNKPKDYTGIYVAIIGLIGTIIVAVIGYLNVRTPIELAIAATQTAEARNTTLARSDTSTPILHSVPTAIVPSMTPMLTLTALPMRTSTLTPNILPTHTPTPTLVETIQSCAFAALNFQTPIRVNLDAALYIAGQDNNLGFAQSDEIQFTSGSDAYVVQDFNTGIVFAKKDDWGNIRIIKKPINVLQASDAITKEVARLADQFSIRINMNSLLMKMAQVQNLGYPRTGEFKFLCRNEAYVGQLFTIAIVYVREKDNEIGIVPYP